MKEVIVPTKYATINKDGSVSVNVAAYLKTPEGQKAFDSMAKLQQTHIGLKKTI